MLHGVVFQTFSTTIPLNKRIIFLIRKLVKRSQYIAADIKVMVETLPLLK